MSLPWTGGGGAVTWLHLSDLHFGRPDATDFDRMAVLRGFVEHVRELRDSGEWAPDLIFVTGDIANRGADEEYKQASAFFDDLLAATQLPKTRMFVVPGNHDVDRTQGEFLDRTLRQAREADAFFAEAPGHGRPSPEDRHLGKLRAFKRWFEGYFAGEHVVDRFSLCAAPTRVDVGDGRAIAVLPLNTATFCLDDSDHNKLWVGRSWLDRMEVKLRAMPADLRVALMHHPLDWLHDGERSQIKAQLSRMVDVVLRGHLHDTEAEATATPIQSVIHLAAGATYQHPQWPRRALYARFDPRDRKLRVRPIRYDEEPHRRWTLDTSLFDRSKGFEGEFDVALRATSVRSATSSSPPEVVAASRPRVASEERAWTIYPDGIAEVNVRLRGVAFDDGLVLAIPDRPYCAVAGDKQTLAPCALAVVRENVRGRTRYRLDGTGKLEECVWRYYISNALALNAYDQQRLHAAPDDLPGFPHGTTGRPHVVRAECGSLCLRYEFADDEHHAHAGPVIETAVPVVESRAIVHGVELWTRVPGAEADCVVNRAEDGRSATLAVTRPLLDHRYTLACTLAAAGRPPGAEAIDAAKQILLLCRGSRADEGGLADDLTARVGQCLDELSVAPLGDRATWIGMLWNQDRNLLLPCFGCHARQQWSVRFPYGGGVAGHAFRFAKVALWCKNLSGRRSVVFQEKTDAGSNYTHDYRWIVSVPLLLEPQGPAIGVVSFASPDSKTAGDDWFEQLALDLGSTDAATVAAARARSNELLELVNVHFWSALKTSTGATRGLQRRAADVLERLAASR